MSGMVTMRSVVALASVVAALALVACGDDGDGTAAPQAGPAVQETGSAAFETVTPADIAPRVDAGEVLLVDVREDDEWEAGHAEEAIHVPLATVGGRLAENEAEAGGRPVAFICRSGNRSAQASQIAVDGGLETVINVDGGMGAWVDAGLPIVPADGEIL